MWGVRRGGGGGVGREWGGGGGGGVGGGVFFVVSILGYDFTLVFAWAGRDRNGRGFGFNRLWANLFRAWGPRGPEGLEEAPQKL